MRVAAAALLAASVLPAAAGGTLTWVETPESLSRGSAERMATTGRGRLFLAPRITPLGGAQTPEGPVQVWSVAADRAGNVYLGTGPEGQVLRVGPSGEPTVHFTVMEPMVTALAVASDGALLAAAAPGGAIYRIEPDGRGEPWALTDERYVWAMAVTAAGFVHVGTGERGRILTVDPDGSAELLYDGDEPHIVSLSVLDDGDVLAGGAGRGLVYRIDDEGHALVLHDDELPEVAALAPEPDGSVVAALIAPRAPAARRPALRLRLPDGVQVGTTDEAVGMLEESAGPTLRGTIEGLEEGPDAPGEVLRGRVVRIMPDGSVRELWSSSVESPFCLASLGEREVVFGTGEPARLYRVEPDGDVARLATLREAQLTALFATGSGVVLATSNPAAAYRLDGERTESGAYVSRAFDAGGPARWGSIRWSVLDPSGRTEVYTRTGNSGEPDATWSAWSPALTDASGSRIVNPDARFFQWRVRQLGSGDPAARLERFEVRYEPYNRPPRIRKLEVDVPAGGQAHTFHCEVEDPDDDAVELTLEYRPAGASGWAVATVTRAAAEPADGESARAGEIVWETSAVPEGAYDVRVVASDQPSNPSGEGLSDGGRWMRRIVIDRSAPRLELVADGREARVQLEDALSDIARLEVLDGDRTRFTVRAGDGVCDSKSESFLLRLPEGASGSWRLRGFDAAGNVVERPLASSGAAN